MRPNNLRWLYHALPILWYLVVYVSPASAQTKPNPQTENQDVVRFDTSLVQTDVMVFDQKGSFVDGLKPEQFQLKINNKQQVISFFERVTSSRPTSKREGTKDEARDNFPGVTPSNPPPPVVPTAPLIQGRAVIFFVDDLHMAPDSLVRTRKALLDFIDHGIGEHDQVAITSPSGQIGFLQQFTPDKVALRSAVDRLNYRSTSKVDMGSPPMSEYIALKIREGDLQAINYYIQQIQKQSCLPEGPGGATPICTVSAQSARQLVVQRAQQITVQSAPDTDNTLRLLEGLMRTAAQLPGRKLVFVISDGFYLNDRKTGALDRIKKVTDAAGRAGVVIYTLDARGIISESLDVTNTRPIDSRGMLVGASIGEITASQDGLNALAKDTGGRALRNTNLPMAEWVDKVMNETSNYYLIAWRPDDDEQKRGKFKNIEVNVLGRPDLTVRVRSGYFKSAALPLLTTKKKSDKDPTKAREDDMRLVIDAPVSQRQIPTEVDLQLTVMPGIGTSVTATVSINDDALTFDLTDGKLVADVDIGGIFYDDKGKPVNSFVGRLRISPLSRDSSTAVSRGTSTAVGTRSIYRFRGFLAGGLYQVRVGVRDVKSSRIGSAMNWITVPKI
jgi:VWFA-related protein